ncbi:unnamed protein product [Meloidogyne enterolobii]|uniref:Uncharacterized protein n=1 Tax=Meloidogyne enterolobii TaxID=390850 RepID=A0ACB1APS5_MELEN
MGSMSLTFPPQNKILIFNYLFICLFIYFYFLSFQNSFTSSPISQNSFISSPISIPNFPSLAQFIST